MAQQVYGYEQAPGRTRTLSSESNGSLVQRTVLPGGLRVITEHLPGVHSVTVGLWVGIGSRDERPRLAGASHYLEHLLFKATVNRDAAGIGEEIDSVGGEFNACTDRESTCFYAQVLEQDLPLALDLVTDVVLRARCADSDVELERAVVLEEIAMRDDDPEDLLHDTFTEALFRGHPLGRSVLGTEDSITGLSPSALRSFYRRRYRLPQMVLAVSGHVEHSQVLKLLHRTSGGQLSGAESPRPPRRGRARIPRGRRLTLRSEDTEQAHLMLGVRAPDRHDERRFALSVLNAALGGGTSSRLFQQVRERRGLAYQVYSSVAAYGDAGQLAVYVGCRPERLGAAAGVVREVLDHVADEGLTDAEITRAKGQLRGGFVLDMEDTVTRMSQLGMNELHYGEYFGVADTIDRIDAVTGDDIAALARALLRPGGSGAVAVVGPYAHDDDLPDEIHEVIA